MIFLFLIENVHCDPSLEPSRRDSSNQRSQYMFFFIKMKLFLKIVPVSTSYLEHSYICKEFTVT